ncbi:hypothetical protein R4M06_02365 [Brachyspira pilosicoli]|uniref:hypothetical protein n=1 Tax=Brachyspira pilosicoli TaxID=52584 RepID=UPI003007481E
MKNKKLFITIYSIFVIIVFISVLLLNILGKKERIGYLSEFKLNIDKTLQINGLDIEETKKLFDLNDKLDISSITNYIFTNNSITNYSYDFRIKYYSKVFRNSDIYEVYPNIDNILSNNGFIKEINIGESGSPFGNFISTKIIDTEKIDNVVYMLKIKKRLFLIIFFVILLIFIFNILKNKIYFLYKEIFTVKNLYLIFAVFLLILIAIYGYYNNLNLIIILFLLSLIIYSIILFDFFIVLYRDVFFVLDKYELLSIFIFLLINLFIILIYMLNSIEILYYDDLVYFQNTVTISNINMEYLKEVLWYNDYSTFFTIPATILSKIFGDSRLSYTLIIFFIYYLPSMLLGAFTVRYILNKYVFVENKVPSFILFLFSYFMIPIFQYNLLHSYHMFGSFFFIFIVIISYDKLKEKEYNNLNLIILISISLIFMFLWKRWMLYPAVSISLLIFIDVMIDYLKTKNLKKIFNLISIGIVGILYILIILYPKLVNYISLSSKFKSYIPIQFMFSYIGLYSIVFILLSIIISFFINKKAIIFNIVLLLLTILSIFIMFKTSLVWPLYNQSFVFTCFLLILFTLLLSNIFYLFFYKIKNIFIIKFVFFIPFMILCISYITDFPYKGGFNLFPYIDLNSKKEDNIDEFKKVYDALPTNASIYTPNFGGGVLEPSLLNSFYLQLKNKIRNLEDREFEFYTSHYDILSGMNYKIFNTDYFFSMDKSYSKEQVVEYPIEVFNKGLNISKAFELENSFIADGITYNLYRRVRKNTKDEIYEYLNHFYNYYTNNSKIFPNPNDIESVLIEYYD